MLLDVRFDKAKKGDFLEQILIQQMFLEKKCCLNKNGKNSTKEQMLLEQMCLEQMLLEQMLLEQMLIGPKSYCHFQQSNQILLHPLFLLFNLNGFN
jgi:hypothetical protein